MMEKINKDRATSLSCQAISFLKKVVSHKQDLLSEKSQREDKLIYLEVLRLEKNVRENKVYLPVDLCLECFQRLNKDYAERNVSCTGIGALGCFLIDYIFTHHDLKQAARDLYGKKENCYPYRQFEWYNHAIASIFDIAAKEKNSIAKNKILGLQNGNKKEYIHT